MGLCSIFGKVYDLSGVRLGGGDWCLVVLNSIGLVIPDYASAQDLKKPTSLQVSIIDQQIWTLSTLHSVI